MNLELLLLGSAGCASLVMIGVAARTTSRESVLNRRIAMLTKAPEEADPEQPVSDTPLRWLEVLLLCVGEDRAEVSLALRAADIAHPHAVVIFAGLRLSLTILMGLAVALLLAVLGRLSGWAQFFPIIASGGTFVLAKMILRSRIAARTRRIGRELPFALDVMLLMLESGVSLDQCLRHLAQSDARAIPTIQRVMTVLVDDLQKGMAYEAALDRWADRMNVSGTKELASLFRQTILHGTELAPALRAFVIEFAEKRISRARDAVGKKTTQMTIVMIIFLMPALMIVIAGPAVSAVMMALGAMAK